MDKRFEVNDGMQELLSDLGDALEIPYSCRRLGVPVTDQFLNYIDELMDQIEAKRPYTLPSADPIPQIQQTLARA